MFYHFQILDETVALDMASRLHAAASWEKGRTRTERGDSNVKFNEEYLAKEEDDPMWESTLLIKDALVNNSSFCQTTMFTKLTVPKFNRYQEGSTYRRHFDASQMSEADMRTDFACTISLNSPDDYEGGQISVEEWDGSTLKAPKTPPGVATVYECGHAHWVSPVTKGERISSILWLRSMVREPEQRKILNRFAHLLNRWESEDRNLTADSEEYTTLTGIQIALNRMWIDT